MSYIRPYDQTDHLQSHIEAIGFDFATSTGNEAKNLTERLADRLRKIDDSLELLDDQSAKDFVRLNFEIVCRAELKNWDEDKFEALLSYFFHPDIYYTSASYRRVEWSQRPFTLSDKPEHTKVINHPLKPDEKVTLHRLIYLVDYPKTYPIEISANQLGGWVSEDVYDQISKHAMVLGEAMVFDHVILNNEVLVEDNAMVFHHVTLGLDQNDDDTDLAVRGYARIFNRVNISTRGEIKGLVTITTPDDMDGETSLTPVYMEADGLGTYTGPASVDSDGEVYLTLGLTSPGIKLHHELCEWEEKD